jgi:hypothetical protein
LHFENISKAHALVKISLVDDSNYKDSISKVFVVSYFHLHFSGPFTTTRVLDKLYRGIISIGVQYALLCSITYSSFFNFPGKVYAFPFNETMGMVLMTEYFITVSLWNYKLCFA